MPDREKVIKGLQDAEISLRGFANHFPPLREECHEQADAFHDAIALLKEYEQSEQSYIRTLVELSNERDKLLKELGREDEHKYKDGSFMAGGNGIVKL